MLDYVKLIKKMNYNQQHIIIYNLSVISICICKYNK